MISALFLCLLSILLMGVFSPEEYFGGIKQNFEKGELFYAGLRIVAGCLAFVVFIGAVFVAYNAIKTTFSPPPTITLTRELCDGFFHTVYSNFGMSVESDIINLCGAGTLRPALGNIRLGGGDRGEKPYNSSIEILMVLNLISRNLGAEAPFVLQAISEPKPDEYLLFNAGTENEITTSGRTFLVKLHEINREPTTDGAPYFSYHFSVNEK